MQIKSLVLVGFWLCSAPSLAQDYPNRPVTFVVPFAPGGSTDVLGRLMGQKLSERLGKPFVIENRPGAGTLTAALQVARGVPDGHTIMMATSSTLAINVTLYKRLPYDPGKDLVVAGLICSVPFALVVDPSLPVNSISDLIKLARERPLSYGSVGPGSFHHLMGELFKATTGVTMTHVPYRGTLPALNDLVAGHIQLMFSDMAPAYPLIQGRKLRALGLTTLQRAASAPEIPALAEVGLPGFDWAAWQSIAVPGGTPKDVVAKLNAAMNATIAEPDVAKKLSDLQFIPIGKGSPEELNRFVQTEAGRWGKVVREAGVAGTE